MVLLCFRIAFSRRDQSYILPLYSHSSTSRTPLGLTSMACATATITRLNNIISITQFRYSYIFVCIHHEFCMLCVITSSSYLHIRCNTKQMSMNIASWHDIILTHKWCATTLLLCFTNESHVKCWNLSLSKRGKEPKQLLAPVSCVSFP